MAKPRKEDQDMEETKRIMERLVKMPHKLHDESKLGKKKLERRDDKEPVKDDDK